jgi:hypothetical protein
MNIFQTSGRWGIAWICDLGHRSKWMLDPDQADAPELQRLQCCKCSHSIEVPMKILPA